LISIAGCEKRLFDKRNKYVGDYAFDYSSQQWDIQSGMGVTTELQVDGEVYYDKSEERDAIHIKLGSGASFDCTINEDGEFTFCGGKGSFDSDQLTMNYSSSSCPGGGRGGGCIMEISGRKK
jgi:hypothetical protein